MSWRLFFGALSWVGGALWWLADRLWGDRIFAVIRPMIPDWLANPSVTAIADWIISYGPPTALIGFGGYLFYSGSRKIRTLANAVMPAPTAETPAPAPIVDGPWRERPSLELYEIACRSVSVQPTLVIDRDPHLSRLRYLADAIRARELKASEALTNDNHQAFYVTIKRDDLLAFAKNVGNRDLARWINDEWRVKRSRSPRATPASRSSRFSKHPIAASVLVLLFLGTAGFVGWEHFKPDWSAPKKNRDALKTQLMKFYADSDPLLSSGWVKTETDLEKYKQDIGIWRLNTRTWIAANMGPGAASFFDDTNPNITQSGIVFYPWTMNIHHNWEVNYVGYLRRNLLTLIETDRWDKP